MARRTHRQRTGQHFLRNLEVARDIVAACCLTGEERVMEIGPGKGFLTKALAPHCRTLVAVEKDAALATILEVMVPGNVRVVSRDILDLDYEEEGPFDVVVGNLPYSISTQITFQVLEWLDGAEGGGDNAGDGTVAAGPGPGASPEVWQRAVLMYQKEFAERIVAPFGGGDYGRLSIGVQRRCEARLVRRVKPGCFDPPPTVESAVIELVPRATPLADIDDVTFFDAMVASLFSQRRKTVRKTLQNEAGALGIGKEAADEVLERLGFGDRRPEELDIPTLASLAKALAATRTPKDARPRSRTDSRRGNRYASGPVGAGDEE